MGTWRTWARVGWLKLPEAMKTWWPFRACSVTRAAVEVSEPETKSPLKTWRIFNACLSLAAGGCRYKNVPRVFRFYNKAPWKRLLTPQKRPFTWHFPCLTTSLKGGPMFLELALFYGRLLFPYLFGKTQPAWKRTLYSRPRD